MEKREYTSKEAAEYIGCKPVTIRQNVLRGKLKPLRKVGFLWVFSSSQIEKFKSHYSPKKELVFLANKYCNRVTRSIH